MVIEAIRLRKLTVDALREHVGSARGAPRLRAVLDAVADLPIAGNRSNAEGEALVRMKAAGSKIPATNKKIAGYEADQVDYERKEISEIDGPGFHADPELDEERNRAWRGDGFTVVRRPSSDVYDPAAEW